MTDFNPFVQMVAWKERDIERRAQEAQQAERERLRQVLCMRRYRARKRAADADAGSVQ